MPLPLVASVAFGRGALPGSPLPESGGHLVTVRGVEGGTVVVHDPAAAPAEVLRGYDAARFAAAWMRWRGAAYVFAREREPLSRADLRQEPPSEVGS